MTSSGDLTVGTQSDLKYETIAIKKLSKREHDPSIDLPYLAYKADAGENDDKSESAVDFEAKTQTASQKEVRKKDRDQDQWQTRGMVKRSLPRKNFPHQIVMKINPSSSW